MSGRLTGVRYVLKRLITEHSWTNRGDVDIITLDRSLGDNLPTTYHPIDDAEEDEEEEEETEMVLTSDDSGSMLPDQTPLNKKTSFPSMLGDEGGAGGRGLLLYEVKTRRLFRGCLEQWRECKPAHQRLPRPKRRTVSPSLLHSATAELCSLQDPVN